MQTDKKNPLFLIPLTLILLLAGCLNPEKQGEAVFKPDSTKQHHNNAMLKRFQDTSLGDQTIAESAIELSKKYRDLSEQMLVLQQKSQKLAVENDQLKKRAATLEIELGQTKKRLAEADNLLIDMITELNNWKVDVLGYRDEMRQASTTQMEILLKIAQALGGEVSLEPDQNESKSQTVPPVDQSSKSQSKQTVTLGNSNE